MQTGEIPFDPDTVSGEATDKNSVKPGVILRYQKTTDQLGV